MTAIVRVELHSANESDYQTLHDAMEKAGFSRTIKSDDGIVYKLPPAEYSFSGEATRSDLLARTKRAAETTGRRYAAVVSETIGTTWTGLDIATSRASTLLTGLYR